MEIKGVGTFLETAKRMLNEHDIVFLVAGGGPYRGKVRLATKILPNLTYVGPLPNGELPAYYNAADLVVVPSLYEEGYARVILEALSCGLPVIASNRGCIPEELDHSVGLLIDPTAEELTHSMLTLYKNGGDLEEMRRNCRPFAEAKFSEYNARVITDAYSQSEV